jgi:hypothetical protein
LCGSFLLEEKRVQCERRRRRKDGGAKAFA